MREIKIAFRIWLLLFWSFCVSQSINAQITIQVDSLISPRIPYRQTLDPATLVQKLTEGKETQLEKFNVIFSWVTNNIRYNYRQFYSGAATKNNGIQRILRRRKGVCTDYAVLMDTLCKFAGIQNTSINGYAKEIIFDVNDSLYFDNHTWNAVKLENKWYLYDVTWTRGNIKFGLTKFGKWRVKKIEQFAKHKKAKIKISKRVIKRDKFCGIPDVVLKDTSRVEKQKWGYRFLTWGLNILPYRIIPIKNYVRNTDYYLTDPEVFALEHFPNDSIWSLSPKYNSLDVFRNDSTHYFDSGDQFREQFGKQIREGQHCFDCDDYLGLSAFDREMYTIKMADRYLSQNPFVKAISELKVAHFYLKDLLKENDSLKKFALFDSTLNYLKSANGDFRNCTSPIAKEYRFHTAKNKAKSQQLRQENRKYLKTLGNLFLAVNNRKKKMSSLEIKSETYEKRSFRTRTKFRNALAIKVSSNLKEEKLKAVQSDFSRAKFKSDSLTAEISLKRNELLLQTKALDKNLSKHLALIDYIDYDFYQDGISRADGLLDSYDLYIRLYRQDIDTLQNEFVVKVEQDVLQLSDSMYKKFMKLYQLIYTRDQTNLKAGKWAVALRANGKYSKDSLELFRQIQLERVKDDICWNRDQKKLLIPLQNDFIYFYSLQKGMRKAINKNSSRDAKRQKIVQKYIETKRKRVNNAKAGNLKLSARMKKVAYDDLNKFKKELKKK